MLKGEYDGYSNKAISPTSMAVGAGTTAGLKGWYYTHVNIIEKKIFLGSERTKVFGVDTLTCTSLPYPDSIYTDSSFVSGYEVGDVLSIVYDNKYEDYATITAIEGNVIALEKIPFVANDFTAGVNTKVSAVGQPDEFSVYCIKRDFDDTLKSLNVSKHDNGGVAFGGASLSEGFQTFAVNIGAHAEGGQTIAKGQYSHAEGLRTQANYSAHAEGRQTTAKGKHSHAEGIRTNAIGTNSHAEGLSSTSFIDLDFPPVIDPNEVSESWLSDNVEEADTWGAALGLQSHTEGKDTFAKGNQSHAEGLQTYAGKNQAHAEGVLTKALGHQSHAEGSRTTAEAGATHSEGSRTIARGTASHAEGSRTMSHGEASHSEGISSSTEYDVIGEEHPGGTATFSGDKWLEYNQTEGTSWSCAYGKGSHVEGVDCFAEGAYSHAEGRQTYAKGGYSHAEGKLTKTLNYQAHAEGARSVASGGASHAEGSDTLAGGSASHAEGLFTVTNNQAEHASGKYNKSWKSSDKAKATSFSHGIGTSDTDRKNAFEVKQNGDTYLCIGGQLYFVTPITDDELDELFND